MIDIYDIYKYLNKFSIDKLLLKCVCRHGYDNTMDDTKQTLREQQNKQIDEVNIGPVYFLSGASWISVDSYVIISNSKTCTVN